MFLAVLPVVRDPMANRYYMTHHEDMFTPLALTLHAPTLEPGLELGLAGECLVARSVPKGPSTARNGAQLAVGSPPAGGAGAKWFERQSLMPQSLG